VTCACLITSHVLPQALTESGLLTPQELEQCIVSEFNPVRVGFAGGGVLGTVMMGTTVLQDNCARQCCWWQSPVEVSVGGSALQVGVGLGEGRGGGCDVFPGTPDSTL
jgi:hypothetical protein